MEGSLLSLVTNNSTNLTREVVDEAFCRDMESFSEAFQVDDLNHRPGNCQPITTTYCAVLYDRSDNTVKHENSRTFKVTLELLKHLCFSSNCVAGTWSLSLPSGTQKRFRYFSSDWKYRCRVPQIFVSLFDSLLGTMRTCWV